MALEAMDAIVILAIVVILFVFGPQKLGEFARSIGNARREVDMAHKGTSSAPAPADPLIETAKKLGIATEGRTQQQISDDIIRLVTEAKTT
jgi:sec-independent protein translocase protein TatA